MKDSHLICFSVPRHRCVAVRESAAQHLHQLADQLGAAGIMTAGKSFTERFLTAVSKMCVDAAPGVRCVIEF